MTAPQRTRVASLSKGHHAQKERTGVALIQNPTLLRHVMHLEGRQWRGHLQSHRLWIEGLQVHLQLTTFIGQNLYLSPIVMTAQSYQRHGTRRYSTTCLAGWIVTMCHQAPSGTLRVSAIPLYHELNASG